MNLTVQDIGETYDRATQIARSSSGYVSVADVVTVNANSRASFELKIPASQLQSVISSLMAMPGVKVDGQSVTSKEVTAEYTDLESRIRNLQRTEAQYQALLGQAKTVDEILSVSTRLDSTRLEIEKAQGRIRLFDSQVEYATVRVQLAIALPPANAGTTEGPTPLRVIKDAWHISVDVAWLLVSAGAVVLVVLAWAVPAALAGVAGLKVYRRVLPIIERIRL